MENGNTELMNRVKESELRYENMATEFDIVRDRLLDLVHASEAALPHIKHDDAMNRLYKAILDSGLHSF